MKKLTFLSLILFICNSYQSLYAQTPTPPNGKKWVTVTELTDEFSGNSINSNKWFDYHPHWSGRAPSKFKKGNAFVEGGYLKLRSTLMKDPSTVNNPLSDIWVNAAACVSKEKSAKPGYYYEARFKASSLSMTSSFWFRVGQFSEIDVIEHIGNPSRDDRQDDLPYEYAANTHYYGPHNGLDNKKATWRMPVRGRDGFHTYGFWWKSPTELLFYYDGKQVMKIVPRVPLTENLKMIFDTEVFPFAQAGVPNIGLPKVENLNNNSKNTMLVDWVRTYKLEDGDGDGGGNNSPTVSFSTPVNNSSFQAPANIQVAVDANDSDGVVSNVKLYINGSFVSQENSAPYNWNNNDQLKNLSEGNYTLKAEVTDNQGAKSSSSITVKVTGNDGGDFEDKISFKNPPTTIAPQNTYTYNLNYEASTNREITVSFWKGNNWVAGKTESVPQGSGIKSITVNLPANPVPGNNYAYKTHIRPVGTSWQDALDNDEIQNVTVTTNNNSQQIENGAYFIVSTTSEQRLLSRQNEQYSAIMHTPLSFNDQKWIFNHLGENVYTIKNLGNNRYLEVPYAKCGNGENVATWTGAFSNHQKWKAVPNGNGVFGLKPMHCQEVGLDRAGGAINANVQVWGYSMTNANQKWRIVPTDDRLFDEIKDETDIKIYPNPAEEHFIISGTEIGDSVEIYDLLGKLMKQSFVKSDQELISIAGLKSGMYIISILGKSKQQLIIK